MSDKPILLIDKIQARNKDGTFPTGILSSPNPIKPGERRGIATEFKPGQQPLNWRPVGTVTVRRRKRKNDQPRSWIKIAEPNVWIPLAHSVWIDANGPIPDGCVIHHKNNNAIDDRIENLQMMTANEHNDIHIPDKTRGRKGITWSMKDVICIKCGVGYRAKVQRKNTLCPSCACASEKESKRRYKERNKK